MSPTPTPIPQGKLNKNLCPESPKETDKKWMRSPIRNPQSASAGSSSSTASGGGPTEKECNEMLKRSLRMPMVKFLKEHMEKSGCSLGDKFIRAVHCDKQIAGGNHMNVQDEVNQVVIRELIHAYDDCRAANLDWTNCAHRACNEIRAGHLSGDCQYKREFLLGHMKMRGHEQE